MGLAVGGLYVPWWASVVADGLVYTVHVEPGGAVLSAVDSGSGAVRWRYTGRVPDSSFLGVPNAGAGLVYHPAGDVLHALDAATGEQRWRVDNTASIPLDPVVVSDGSVVALDAATGAQRWRVDPERSRCPGRRRATDWSTSLSRPETSTTCTPSRPDPAPTA